MENEKKGIKCSYAVLVIVLFAALAFVVDYAVIERKLNKCSCPDCSAPVNTNVVTDDSTVTEKSSEEIINDQNENVTFLTDTELKFYCDEYLIKVADGNIIINAYNREMTINGLNAKYVYTNGIIECGNYNLYFLTEKGLLFEIKLDTKNTYGRGYDLNLVATNVKGVVKDSDYEKVDEEYTAHYMLIMTLDGQYNKIYYAFL